jgi:hypothetical protein
MRRIESALNAWTRTALIGVLALPGLGALAADADPEETIIRSTEGYVRDSAERGAATLQQLKEQRTLSADALSKPRASAPSSSTVLADQWIYDADVVLYDDLDDDGYFRYLSVRLDADTYLNQSWVYAMLYLSDDGQTWTHFYTTEDFLIGGTVADDEYFVETELLAGYPTGLYDVLIELYDADYASFVDEFGPNQSSAMSLLPIEDASRDVPPLQITISSGHGGGGAMSLGLLPGLVAAWFFRRRRSIDSSGERSIFRAP